MSIQSTPKSFIVKPSEQVPLRIVGETIAVLANADATGSYEVFFQTTPEGAGPPPHFHPWDEAYYMLDGKLEITADGETKTVSAGEFVHIPHGVLHSFRAPAGGARFISINSKGGAAKFFADLDREIAGEMDIPKILSVAARHNIQVPPPPAMQ